MIKYRIILGVAFLAAAFFPIASNAANRSRLFLISFAWPIVPLQASSIFLPIWLFYFLAIALIGLAIYAIAAPSKVMTRYVATYLFVGALFSLALAQVPLR